METLENILSFWFGTETDDARVAARQAALWWRKDARTDADIRARFASTVELALQDQLRHWLATPRGRLAAIVLADQFPRNIYRDTPRAFAGDALALSWCREGLEQGADQVLRPIERVFFYLPLEHSESLADQDESVRRFEALLAGVAPELQKIFQTYLDFACRHREIIARFGRFPHRNRILGRTTTPEEAQFLQQPGSGF